ncbi:non-ribosomal peptide synthetase [Niveomyces insectorum RCEF 264]|uniref:Non-ribosomal peptide synthetase n=1 Tax=Niveomyces insectorum RCEF 264 TaxID=1081102 RepID=A0A167SJU7_9HYPO|nr:non-ribosomal peptide synthetase [Niveomyces insectorum RCEF 264]
MDAARRLSILNPQPRKLPGPSLLHELVAGNDATAATVRGSFSSDHIALDYRAPDGHRVALSYRQLHRVASRLAAEIHRCRRAAAANPSSSDSITGRTNPFVVPVLLPQAPELYVALLAILKAGGAFCPIQLDAPPDRVRFILGDVAASVVLTTGDVAARFPPAFWAEQQQHVVLVDDVLTRGGGLSLDDDNADTVSGAPVGTPSPEDLAYVMYTSGSTGTPKGVGVPHAAATQSLLAHDRHVPHFRRFLQFAAPTFDVSVFEIFFPWLRGATLACCSRADMLNDLPAVLRNLDVDACELTPTVAGSLLRSRDNAPGLHLLLTIGEMLTEPVIREFGAAPGRDGILWAMYGPTEAAIHCTLQPCLDASSSVRNIGFPLDTVSAFILAIPEDEQRYLSQGKPEIVPLGEIGELAVGGHQLAGGYLDRPEQTAAAFVNTAAYGRLYRTGDKARVTEQGQLECFGRLSGGQVKLHGQRLELGEVEQAALRTSGCLGSVAAVANGVLVLFCDVGSNMNAVENLEETILESCRAWLPRFMVPGDVVLLAQFPRLASGKVDRKRLSSEYASARARSADSAPPLTPTTYKDDLDRLLHSIAREILGCEVKSRTASLAAAGIDSLQSIRFAASLRSSGFKNVSAVDVLEAKTMNALHARVLQLQHLVDEKNGESVAQNSYAAAETTPLAYVYDSADVIAKVPSLQERTEADDIARVMACTPVQVAMLAETLADPKAYCNWVELAFAQEISENEVASCFQSLIEKNEALRTGFVRYEGKFVQVVWRHPTSEQIQQTSEPVPREFRLETEESLLHPFHVTILARGVDEQKVHAILRVHHAAYDGWSMDLIRSDLNALLRGQDVASRAPYSSVAGYYQNIPTEETNAATRFWAQLLNGCQLGSLPELNPRRNGNAQVLTKEAVLLAGLEKVQVEESARRLGCGTQVLFQAALLWLWSAMSGTPDVVVGTVTSGRTIPLDGIESVVGPCLQTVPLRADVSLMRTIRDLLVSIQSTNRASLPYTFLPLAEIKKIAGVRPGQPLYHVLFVYQESLYSQNHSTKALVSEVAHKDYLETKLLWEVEPDEEGFKVRATFHADLFPEAQITSMIEQFTYVVRHAVANVDHDLSTMFSSIPSHLLSHHNVDYRSFDGCPDLGRLVQQVAHRTPDRPALCFATAFGEDDSVVSQTLSFRELNRLANRIARCLRSQGAQPGDAVAIVMEKSILLYAGILGIIKAGCAYLPLLPSIPIARAEAIFEQARVYLYLTDTAAARRLVFSRLSVTALDLQKVDFGNVSDEDDDIDNSPVDASRITNIIYTSGSTGVPKGVCVTQLNICSNLEVLSRIYPLRADGRLLQSCSQAFDVSVFEIFFTWIYGMCLCSATNDVLFEDLERAIRLLRVSHLSMTPTVASLVDPKNTPSVEFLVTSGEPLTEAVSGLWTKQLYQGYGPSETTNICTVKKMAPGYAVRHLGFGFENTSSFVLRIDGLDAVPLGSVGEFCFGGDQVAAGYLNQPDLTAEKFIQHPLYGHLYRSGDLGRMLPDGSLMITGRIDDQIKLRGQRIELNGINAVLRESSLIAEALTLLVQHEHAKSDQLVSFCVFSGLSSPTALKLPSQLLVHPNPSNAASITRQVFRLLQANLPAYMVPTFLIPISSVPLTPAGKADKNLLRRLFRELPKDHLAVASISTSDERGDEGGLDDDTRWTDLEQQVARIVSDALEVDVPSVGRWTPLASLGLDSISAIHVARCLYQILHKRLAISDVLKNASVSGLVQLLAKDSEDEMTPSAYSLDVFSPKFLSELQRELDTRGLCAESVLPCTPLQEAMLVSPTRGKSYVNRMLFRLKCQPDKMRASWNKVCERHEILRTCFVTTDNPRHPIAQVVLQDHGPTWLQLQQPDSTTDQVDGNNPVFVDSLTEKHAGSLAAPLDSFQPPVSFAVISCSDGCFLSFVCHHAVYDGEAMSRLLFEVERLAQGEVLAPETPPRFRQFLELALAQPPSTDGFWRKHLADYQPVLFKTKDIRAANGTGVLAKNPSFPLSAIQGRAKELSVSLLTISQSAWACVLCILTNKDDITFGNVYNGRSLPLDRIEELVAPCFNTLPIRVNLSNLRSNNDLLSYFQNLNPEIMRYQFTPLRQIQQQHEGGAHLFDTLLLLQQPARPLDDTLWTLERDDGEMDFPLVCELVPDYGKDNLEIRLHYDRLVDTLLWLSSSHVSRRHDLSPQMQARFDALDITFDYAARDKTTENERALLSSGLDESWNEVESVIRSVFSRLADVPENNIRRDTTIYRLGLDSVRAVQVAAMLRKQGLPVSAVDVMENPNCMDLAHFVATRAATGSDESTPVIAASPNSSSGYPSTASSPPPLLPSYESSDFRASMQPFLDQNSFFVGSEVEAVIPCTPLQAGLLSEFIRSEGKHYFNFLTCSRNADAAPSFRADDWKQAWENAAVSIPMLRTGFFNVDNDDDDESSIVLSPFGMVQFSAKSVLEDHIRVSVVQKNHASEFNLNNWRTDATRRAFCNLGLPPWQVVLVENGDDDTDLACHLAIHHALYDATSLSQILAKVASFLTNRQPVLDRRSPPTELAVSDIRQQVKLAASPSSDLAEAWEKKAAQAVSNTFPILTPLKVSSAISKIFVRSSSRPFRDLTAAARESGFTVHAILQAAWTRILSSYVGDTAVVFGTVLSGRNTKATEEALFPCLTTLPVIAENDASNRKLVEQMMGLNVLLHKSQHVPLSQIQRWLGRTESRLFDTLFVFQNYETDTTDSSLPPPSRPWTVVDEKATVEYTVSIEAIPQAHNGTLKYQITYDNSIIPEEHASLLLDQLDAVVCHIAFHPEENEEALVPLEPRIYSVLPAAKPELFSEVKLLHQFVEAQADTNPGKTALSFVTAFDADGRPVSKEWTFAALNNRANEAAELVSQHAQPGAIVAVCFDKCPEAFFSILGVLKAGCSFVALDPGAPPSRKEFILRDSGAALLLVNASRAQDLSIEMNSLKSRVGVPIVIVDEATLEAQHITKRTHPTSPIRRDALPSDICYCLYTSGTTGTPKGCAITHENAVQALLAFQELFRGHWDENSRWLQFASFHFDVSVLEQYWTWSVGMTLVAAPRDLILDDLAGTISRLGITHIDLTPSLGRLLDPKDVPSLCRGVFITGGEPLKPEMLDSWGPTGAVHNFYGPTEATIGVTSYPRVPRNGRASNIGRQFPNVGTFVFRPGTQTPVLRGAVGELCVSGKLVGKGYLNRDDLTDERFPTLEHNAAYPGNGERVYRTGDLVRLLHDGCFDFLGRADDQVKLRGQRLEIGEINHAIRLGVGPSVGDVATLVIRDEENKKDFLVSFVVLSETASAPPAIQKGLVPLTAVVSETAATLSRRVQAACRERLPAYMVPTYVVQLPFIPLSPNNKAEAKELKRLFTSLQPDERLRATGAETSVSSRQAVFIQSPTGRKISDVLHQLSFLRQGNDIQPDMNVFELGIDSISALRFARALKRAGLPATPSLVLTHPVLSDLAATLDLERKTPDPGSLLEARLLVAACQHRNRNHICDALGIASDKIEYIAPCSALQEGMISRSRSSLVHRQTYFNTFVFNLKAGTSVGRLKSAWQKVVDENAILRTCFVATPDGFIQAALKATPLSWEQLECDDYHGLGAALDHYRESWVDANQGDVMRTPLKACTVSCGSEKLLVLHVFHGLYDATSLDLVLDRVVAAYENDSSHKEQQPEVPRFLEALIHGPFRSPRDSRSFWEAHLRSIISKPLPVLGAKPAAGNDVSARRTMSFVSLDGVRVSLGVTHSALVQALFVSVLQKYYNGSVTLGLVLSGRTMEDLDHTEDVVGPLFNTLPFYAPKRRGETWSSLAQTCHSFGIAALPFQQVPLREIQKWCSGGRSLFDVLFSFQFGKDSVKRQALWTQTEPEAHADYPLALEAVYNGADGRDHLSSSSSASLELLLVANDSVADKVSLENILDDIEASAQAMLAAPQKAIFDADSNTFDVSPAGDAGLPNLSEVGGSVTVNGQQHSQHCSVFLWEGGAEIIRREMAHLSGVMEETISEDTSLLALGLDSVDTIKLSARLRSAGIFLSNTQLVQGQTIAAFLSTIKAAADEVGEGQGVATDVPDRSTTSVVDTSAALERYFHDQKRDITSVETILPSTPLQDAMAADMINSGFTRYFNHDVFELAPSTDLSRLKAAWITIVASNPILRTVFLFVDSPDFEFAYCQAVTRGVDEHRLFTAREIEDEGGLNRIISEANAKARKGQGESDLLQLTFAHSTIKRRRYLVLSIAHALYDGRSLELLHQRVEAAYETAVGVISTFSPSKNTGPSSMSPYVHQLSRILRSSGVQAHAFWQNYLADTPLTYVKRRQNDARQEPPEKAVIRADVKSSISAAELLEFCRRQATSAQVVGQACWAAVLATMTGSLDVVFGVVLSGRDTDDAPEENGLFPTMNTVPVRVVLHGTTAELLHYMQSNMQSINEHQHYPLRKAQKWVPRREDNGEAGIFNSLFILQKRLRQEPVRRDDENGQSGKELLPMKSVKAVSDVEYPICIEMEICSAEEGRPAAIVWRTACDVAYVSSHGAVRILHQLDAALGFLVRPSATSPAARNVLEVENDGVSVCGLSPFLLSLPDDRTQQRQSQSENKQAAVPGGSSRIKSQWSADEEAIRSVLAAVSGTPENSIQRTGHTLYALGLDSISAIKVNSLLKKTKGIALGVRDLLSAGSVQEMATLAAAKRQQLPSLGSGSELQHGQDLARLLSSLDAYNLVCHEGGGINPALVEFVLPATAMQVHMVSAWQNTNGQIFFPEFRYCLKGMRFRRSVFLVWRQLVAEFPILRTTLLATASKTVPLLQVVVKAPSTAAEECFEDKPWAALAAPAKSFAFLSVLRGTDSGSFSLALKVHHALYDAISLQAILERFRCLCGQAVLTAPIAVPAVHEQPAPSVASWTQLLAKQTATSTRQHHQRFWTDYFQATEQGNIAGFAVSPSVSLDTPQTSRVSCFQPAALPDTTFLREGCAKHGIGLQSLLIAAYAKILSQKWQAVVSTEENNDRAVAFGVYLANRQEEADGDAGNGLTAYPTLCLVPLRVSSPTQGNLLDIAKRIQDDIHAISTPASPSCPAPLTAGLWEVKEWTGVCVNSFVNFLLPDRDVTETKPPDSGGILHDEEVNGSDAAGQSHFNNATDFAPEEYPGLRGNPVRAAYPDAVDVELAVRGTRLDVGVFGPTNILGEDGAAQLVAELTAILRQGVDF